MAKIRLEADARAPRAVRAWLAQAGPPITGRTLAEMQLVASELVSNSLRHAGLAAGEAIEVCRRIAPGGLMRIEVADGGPGFPRPGRVPMPPARDPGGRGLALVDRIADRWGVLRDDAHRVWCEFDRRDQPPAGSPPAGG